MENKYQQYIDHTTPNDETIDKIIQDAQLLGTFEQHGIKNWLFRGIHTVGHIIDVSENKDKMFLVSFHHNPYLMFSTIDEAQKRMLVLDILLPESSH